MGPLVIGILGFACFNVFNSVNDKEVFDLRVLGFAYCNIYNTDNDKETFDLGVLGRGRAGQITI